MTSTAAQPATPQEMTVDDLDSRCKEETGQFFGRQGYDPSPCFELFRRALVENDQRAWEMVYARYWPLVRGWVANHPAILYSGGEIEDFANRAFARMWAALTPDKLRRFPHLNSVLAYLKMCAHSAVMEGVRKAGPNSRAVSLSDLSEDGLDVLAKTGKTSTEGELLARERSQELWSLVRARLHDDRERVVVHDLFVLDLKPAAIRARHPDMFPDTREVYLLRQVVLERLSRDARLKEFFGSDA
jgi:DNA-directed RNA polymerase specialized sigma24 family protein